MAKTKTKTKPKTNAKSPQKSSRKPFRRLGQMFTYLMVIPKETWRLVWEERSLFARVLVLHLVAVTMTAGVISQADYHNLSDSLSDNSGSPIGNIVGSLVLFGASLSGNFGSALSPVQEFFLWTINFMSWLVIVWLIRQRLAESEVNLRDGLYNGLAPLVSSAVVWIIVFLEMLPSAIGTLIFSLSIGSGAVHGFIGIFVFSLITLALILLSLYLVAGSLVGAVVVTLPGVYPWAALKSASRLVAGKRFMVIGHVAWMCLLILVAWAVVLIPVILLDKSIGVDWLPLVPVAAQVLSSATLIFVTTYIYLLYRGLSK